MLCKAIPQLGLHGDKLEVLKTEAIDYFMTDPPDSKMHSGQKKAIHKAIHIHHQLNFFIHKAIHIHHQLNFFR